MSNNDKNYGSENGRSTNEKGYSNHHESGKVQQGNNSWNNDKSQEKSSSNSKC